MSELPDLEGFVLSGSTSFKDWFFFTSRAQADEVNADSSVLKFGNQSMDGHAVHYKIQKTCDQWPAAVALPRFFGVLCRGGEETVFMHIDLLRQHIVNKDEKRFTDYVTRLKWLPTEQDLKECAPSCYRYDAEFYDMVKALVRANRDGKN